jgi:hypothetical protein
MSTEALTTSLNNFCPIWENNISKFLKANVEVLDLRF